MRYVRVPFKKLMRAYRKTIINLMFSYAFISVGVVVAMIDTPQPVNSWMVFAGVFYGNAIACYECESRHSEEAIMDAVEESAYKVAAVQEAEDIIRRGF